MRILFAIILLATSGNAFRISMRTMAKMLRGEASRAIEAVEPEENEEIKYGPPGSRQRVYETIVEEVPVYEEDEYVVSPPRKIPRVMDQSPRRVIIQQGAPAVLVVPAEAVAYDTEELGDMEEFGGLQMSASSLADMKNLFASRVVRRRPSRKVLGMLRVG